MVDTDRSRTYTLARSAFGQLYIRTDLGKRFKLWFRKRIRMQLSWPQFYHTEYTTCWKLLMNNFGSNCGDRLKDGSGLCLCEDNVHNDVDCSRFGVVMNGFWTVTFRNEEWLNIGSFW